VGERWFIARGIRDIKMEKRIVGKCIKVREKFVLGDV